MADKLQEEIDNLRSELVDFQLQVIALSRENRVLKLQLQAKNELIAELSSADSEEG